MVFGTQNIERVAAGVNHRVRYSTDSNFYHSVREFRFPSNIFHAGHSQMPLASKLCG